VNFSLRTWVEVPNRSISSNETLGQLPEATSTGRALYVQVPAIQKGPHVRRVLRIVERGGSCNYRIVYSRRSAAGDEIDSVHVTPGRPPGWAPESRARIWRNAPLQISSSVMSRTCLRSSWMGESAASCRLQTACAYKSPTGELLRAALRWRAPAYDRWLAAFQ
jgi:hypothetical protein